MTVQAEPKRIRLHAGQAKVMRSDRRFVLASAGTQSGKTWVGPHWMLQEIRRAGPGDYLVASPSYQLMGKKALPEFLNLAKRELKLGYYRGGEHKNFTFTEEGSRRFFGINTQVPTVVWFGHAADSDSLESATYKAAWLDEAGQSRFKYESWLAILRRLSIHQGRVLITTTPYNLGWLKQQVYDRWKAGEPEYDVIRFDSKDNPAFPLDEYYRAERTMPGWKFRMFYRGFFERPAGLIYDCLESEIHVMPPFALPSTWRRYMGADFGGVNTAAVFLAEDPRDKSLYLYREYWEGGRTAKGHAKAMLKDEPGIPTAVGGAKSEGQWRDEFRAGGLPIREPLVSDVAVGISRVYTLIKSNRLRIFRTCARTLDQLQSYSYKVNESGEATEEIEDKASFHLCFVAGTLVTAIDGDKPIESVEIGDQVLTRGGWRRVVAAGQTKISRTMTVILSNGATLTGTPDHPIWVQGNGFTRIDALKYGDIITTCERPSLSTASRTTATRTRSGSLTDGTSSGAGKTCTGLFGSIIAARFRTAGTFITKMAMQTTTPLRIWKLFRAACICLGTFAAALPRRKRRFLTRFARSLRRGIKAKRGGSGTASTGNASRPAWWNRTGRVKTAGSSIVQNPSAVIAIAPANAERTPAESRASTTSKKHVPDAALSLLPIGTRERPAAPCFVRRVEDSGVAKVYNLTVDDRHEYFANGVLVSNCDALRYIGTLLGREQVRLGPGSIGREPVNRSIVGSMPPGVFGDQ